MKKKIAIFQTDLSLGGIQRSLINLLNSIDVSKYCIDLYLFSNNKFYLNEIPAAVNIIYLTPKNKFLKFVPFRFAKLLYKSNIKKEYDIAIDYNGYSNYTALETINCKSKLKYMWIHSDLYERKKKDLKYRILYIFSRGKFKYMNQFISVSSGVKESFDKMQRRPVKNVVIPNVILDEDIIKKSNEPFTNFLDNDYVNFVSMGRLCYAKGFDILLKYMAKIVNRDNGIRLYIIGSGSYEKRLKKQINRLGLSNNVYLLGKRENPFNIMKNMDAFILTSRYEGQGMAILEAMVLGLPVFITKNLENYVDNLKIKGSEDIVNDVLKFRKSSIKKTNNLYTYNQLIIKKIEQILK